MPKRLEALRQRLAFMLCLALAAGTIVGISVVAVLSAPQVAVASVAAGDVVYERAGDIYKYRAADQSNSAILTSSEGYPAEAPDVSPDGSRIAYVYWGSYLYVINSDGSGATEIAGRVDCEDNLGGDCQASQTSFAIYNPRWSPDGQWIVFSKYSGGTGTWRIKKVRADGSAQTTVVSYGSSSGTSPSYPTWSPDSNRIAYNLWESGLTQVRIVDASGSNDHRITSSMGSYNDIGPSWSPNGSRIYVSSNEAYSGAGNGSGITYFTYAGTDAPFSTTSVTRASTPLTTESNYKWDFAPRVSADGSTIYFETNGHGGTMDAADIAKVNSSGGTVTRLTATTWDRSLRNPSSVSATYPAAPPSNSTVTLSAPSPSDAPYTRNITVGLSSTGNQRFEYGWSTSSTTAPNTAYLQTTTDMVNRKGTLNFLGKYSGSGTTWNGGTQPDQDWYLWVRSVKTTGVANAWGTPLKVRTPKRPVWVGSGDSYSSGHHQDVDQPWCPDPADTYYTNYQSYWNCPAGNTATTPNDLAFSWVKWAVDRLNSTLHAPSAWSYTPYLVAVSGKPTSNFGVAGQTRGSDAWATGDTQSAYVRGYLYTQYSSWPILSKTGGANDTNWADVLASFYVSHFITGSPAPWAVSTSNPSADCPDSQSVWNSLKAIQSDGLTLDAQITANLQGMVSVANRYAPGVRILNVGYPYVVDSSNSCSANSGSWHGSKSVIDSLNADHSAVTGSNVHYINLTSSGGFGTNPVSSNYLQLTRLYGYPHPEVSGQVKMANMAVADLTTATW